MIHISIGGLIATSSRISTRVKETTQCQVDQARNNPCLSSPVILLELRNGGETLASEFLRGEVNSSSMKWGPGEKDFYLYFNHTARVLVFDCTLGYGIHAAVRNSGTGNCKR